MRPSQGVLLAKIYIGHSYHSLRHFLLISLKESQTSEFKTSLQNLVLVLQDILDLLDTLFLPCFPDNRELQALHHGLDLPAKDIQLDSNE